MITYILVFSIVIVFAFYLKELRQRYDLELKLNLVKERFSLRGLRAREFAHELKHPISAIITTLDSILISKKSNSTSEISIVANEAREIYEYINNFLLICMAETGHLNGRPSTQNLHEVLEQIKKLLKVKASLKNISIDISNSMIDVFVFADKTHLKQIFFNLINNAIEHNPEETKVSIECMSTEDDTVEVIVKDNGKGISLTDRSKILNIISGFGDTRETSSIGGLGLHLSSELTKFSGGKLSLLSDTGKGTCFQILLPIAKNDSITHFTETKKVLLLSEGNSCSANIAKQIQSLGCSVESISEVISALEALGNNDYDAVIVDHKIDNDSGFELAKLIDEELELGQTKKFVALSDEDFDPEIFSLSDKESWPIKRGILKELIS